MPDRVRLTPPIVYCPHCGAVKAVVETYKNDQPKIPSCVHEEVSYQMKSLEASYRKPLY